MRRRGPSGHYCADRAGGILFHYSGFDLDRSSGVDDLGACASDHSPTDVHHIRRLLPRSDARQRRRPWIGMRDE
jgi:hypothetical protein